MMVYVHGAGGFGGVWQLQERHFHSSDAVTLPGHPEGAPSPSIEGYRDWLRGYIERSQYGPVVLAGHSMGGGIALSYALEHQSDVRALVLVATGARLRVNPAFLKLMADNLDKPPSWFRDMAKPMFEGVDPSIRDMILDRECTFPISTHLNDFLCCDRFDVMERVPEIKVPVLVLCGDRDAMTPAKYSRFMADRIIGSRIAIIPGAGHMVMLEKPEEVNREIESFLRDIQ